jgi:hypothetical protein
VVVVALLLLFLPGMVGALLLRTPWLAAIALAPALSTTTVVVLSVISAAVGVPWGPVPLVAGVLAAWLVSAGLGVLLGRHTPREQPSRLPIAALATTAMAAVVVALVQLPVSRTPETFPQGGDTIFHLGATQWMVEHKDASVLHVMSFLFPSQGGFYPAAFHTMVATLTQLTGAAVAVSMSSFVLVVAGVAWPLGCIFLARTLFGPDLAVQLSAGALSVAFSAYPFMLMAYGVVYPTLFGNALIPGALALLAVALSTAHRQSPALTSRLRAVVLLTVVVPGLALAHVNAIITFLLFGYIMAAGVILRRAWVMRGRRPAMALATVAGLVTFTALAFLASTVPNSRRTLMRNFGIPGQELPVRPALYDMLTFARRGIGPAWILTALVAVGAVIVILRYPGRRWLVPALVITSAIFYLNVVIDSPAVRLLTWPWSNQSVRLAAIVVLPAMLLATVALATGARLLGSRLGLASWPTAVALPLVFLVATGGAYLGTHRFTLDQYYHPNSVHSWASNRELRALHALARFVPADAVVAANPWNGGNYLYVVSGRHMLIPTEKALSAGDRLLLAHSLQKAGSSPKVCAAAQRQRTRFAITGGRPYANAGTRAKMYAGIDAVGSSDAFREVAQDRPYTLYEMVKCAKG